MLFFSRLYVCVRLQYSPAEAMLRYNLILLSEPRYKPRNVYISQIDVLNFYMNLCIQRQIFSGDKYLFGSIDLARSKL